MMVYGPIAMEKSRHAMDVMVARDHAERRGVPADAHDDPIDLSGGPLEHPPLVAEGIQIIIILFLFVSREVRGAGGSRSQ